PICERRDTGTAGPTAITPAGSACRRSTRRPASRSAPRVDGASTVTVCPRSRKASAIPATCSLTSWGWDHANGVTRQILMHGLDPSADASVLRLRGLLGRLTTVLLDELFALLVGLVVDDLLLRRLHQVQARA